MRFWDSSAVIPLVVQEDASVAAQHILSADLDMAVWWGTVVECFSAIGRLERAGLLSAEGADAARGRLGSVSAGWSEVQPSDSLRRTALRMLRLHALRAADALQGAAALTVAEHDPPSVGVVCRDRRLTAALRREGMAVEVPGALV